MRLLYITYAKCQTLSGKSRKVNFEPKLSWSCYCELLRIEEDLARSFYEKETIENGWSVRELKRHKNKKGVRDILFYLLKKKEESHIILTRNYF